MARFPSFPTLYDEVLQLKISGLKESGFLHTSRKGTLHWESNGERISSLSIESNANIIEPYVQLNYKYNGKEIKYKLMFVTVPSNLGKGLIWYFLCPVTNKRCRKLYLINGYFLHRDAFDGCMYDCQTKSKMWRRIGKQFGRIFDRENAYEEIYSKHFKSHYAGRPTKRCRQLIKQIRVTENISLNELKDLF